MDWCINAWSAVDLERPIHATERGRFTVIAEGDEHVFGPDGGRDNPDLGLIEARFRRELPKSARQDAVPRAPGIPRPIVPLPSPGRPGSPEPGPTPPRRPVHAARMDATDVGRPSRDGRRHRSAGGTVRDHVAHGCRARLGRRARSQVRAEQTTDAIERAAGTGLTGSSAQEFVPCMWTARNRGDCDPTAAGDRQRRKRCPRRGRCRNRTTAPARPARATVASHMSTTQRSHATAASSVRPTRAERRRGSRSPSSQAWRAARDAGPDAPLDADDLARLVRSCFEALGIDGAVGLLRQHRALLPAEGHPRRAGWADVVSAVRRTSPVAGSRRSARRIPRPRHAGRGAQRDAWCG